MHKDETVINTGILSKINMRGENLLGLGIGAYVSQRIRERSLYIKKRHRLVSAIRSSMYSRMLERPV